NLRRRGRRHLAGALSRGRCAVRAHQPLFRRAGRPAGRAHAMGAGPDAAQRRADQDLRLAHPLRRAHRRRGAPPARAGRAQRGSAGRIARPGGAMTAMTDTVLAIDKSPQVWTYTLNRPDKRNALSAELVEALIEGVDAAHAEQIPLLVFRGAGKNFSAGFDFTGYEAQSEGDLLLRMVRIETLLQRVAGSPSLTLALAHGRNFGAGVDLVAACKLRLCTPDASFRMPGLKFGLVLGTRRFRNMVGADNALSILGS